MSSRIESNVCSQLPESQSSEQSTQPASQSQQSIGNAVCSYADQRSVDTGYAIDNPNAAPTAQGSKSEQAKQAAVLTAWTYAAGLNAAKLGDFEAQALLKQVSPTPPDVNKQTEYVNYASTIRGVSAQAAFDYFKKHPQEWFGAAGITLHPPVKELTDGARVGLAEPGVTPPVIAPIEIHIDEASRTVNITTLDGHPLRGVNQFTFEENAQGDCEMRQSSAFQLSSFASEQGSNAMSKAAKAGVPFVQDAIQRQHQIWERAHANVADQAPRR